MPVSRLVICHWLGVERQESVIENPSWHVVAHAVGAMDGQQGNDLYLFPEAEQGSEAAAQPHLVIYGGGGRYLVRGITAEKRVRVAVDPSRWTGGMISLVTDGQLGDYPSHWVVDLGTVIAAARVYWSKGGFSSEVCWEDDD